MILIVTVHAGLENRCVIAERLNEAGYQTKAGKAWDKDIYSAWKRQGGTSAKISVVVG